MSITRCQRDDNFNLIFVLPTSACLYYKYAHDNKELKLQQFKYSQLILKGRKQTLLQFYEGVTRTVRMQQLQSFAEPFQ